MRLGPSPVTAVRLFAFGVLSCMGGSAFAQGATSQSDVLAGNPASISAEGLHGEPAQTAPFTDRLTGDWGGLRTKLDDRDIVVISKYTSETAANPFGGLDQGVRYTQQVSLGFRADMGKLMGVDGGQLTFNLTRRDGKDLKPVVGSLRSPQELYGAGQTTRLSELSYVQRLFSDHLELEFGYEAAGNDFATSKLYCYFQSGMYCGHNPALASNSGWYNSPTGQWGANIKVQDNGLYAQFGVYQVKPELAQKGHGFDLGFNGTGVLIPVEFGWVPEHGLLGLPGRFKAGFYYDTSVVPNVLRDINGANAGLTGLAKSMVHGRYGGWIQADQMLHRAPGYSDTRHGLAIFANFTVGDRRTAQYDYGANVGLIQMGTFPSRASDFVGIAIGMVHVNSALARYQTGLDFITPGRVGVQSREITFEVDYGLQATPWLQVRPNLQYIQRPGAASQIKDAFVTGLTLGIDL